MGFYKSRYTPSSIVTMCSYELPEFHFYTYKIRIMYHKLVGTVYCAIACPKLLEMILLDTCVIWQHQLTIGVSMKNSAIVT